MSSIETLAAGWAGMFGDSRLVKLSFVAEYWKYKDNYGVIDE